MKRKWLDDDFPGGGGGGGGGGGTCGGAVFCPPPFPPIPDVCPVCETKTVCINGLQITVPTPSGPGIVCAMKQIAIFPSCPQLAPE